MVESTALACRSSLPTYLFFVCLQDPRDLLEGYW